MIEIQEIEEKARKRKYICPSLEIHYSEEDDWIMQASVEVTVKEGTDGDEDKELNPDFAKHNYFDYDDWNDDDWNDDDY